MDYVEQEYWDKSYEDLSLEFSNDDDPLVTLISKVLKSNSGKGDVIEFGCYPGKYLKVFGDFGLCLNGIDTTEKVTRLPAFFNSKGYCVGDFIRGDLFKYTPGRKFDIVCSFGFIEHFTNWQDVVLLHLKFVKQGGLIFITVPNFRGFFQRYFHQFFDKENLHRHNLKAMDVKQWNAVLQKNNIDYDILFQGPFGAIEFWVDEEKRSKLKRYAINKILVFLNLFKTLKLAPSKSYSPYLGLIIKLQ
ncbi:MAG: methyltransferase domain-containing protein [Segetibacter sp.]|nr:methyltransferase domain-containing protein [Segetibacter sp.]